MSQKTKNILLVIGFFIIVIVAYQYAIVKTMHLKKEYKALKQEALAFDNMPLQLSSLKQREHYYDSLLTKYQLGESSVQNNMLSIINTYANTNQLKVVDFVEPHRLKQNDLNVNTYKFILEGNFNAILSLIYQLEQHTKFGEIINLNFKRQKSYKTGKQYLQAIVLLKSFG
jgi:hypothetical protein